MPTSANLKNLPTGDGLTFEKVWAMFQETDRKFQETDRKFQETREQMKETDRMIRETKEQMKDTDRRIGELGNRFGELAEHLVAPSIMDKFNELGFHFTQISADFVTKDPKTKKTIAEVDILLENGDVVIAVEVKSKPKKADVDEHFERMEKLRYAADLRRDKRHYRGAIAGAIMKDSVREHALKLGLYVIEQTGDTVKIVIPKGFKPHEW